MPKEIELKFACSLRFDPLYLFCHDDVVKVRKKLHVLQMETKYFDTENGDLAKRGITLRQRIEDGESYIYAKTTEGVRNGMSIRNEWRTKSDCIETAAKRLSTRGAPTHDFIGVPLIVTCDAKFEREECPVVPHEGFEYILSHDIGVFNGKTEFAEVEFELVKGDMNELIEVATKIAKSLKFTPEPRSKHQRALLFKNTDVRKLPEWII